MVFLQQYPHVYYSGIFLSNIVITVGCLFAARWLRGTKLKPPLRVYVLFNLLFILFPLIVLAWYEDILTIMSISFLSLAVMSVSFLSSAVLCMFFLGIMLFLFYLYTRLAAENPAADDVQKTADPLLITTPEAGKYLLFLPYLSKRELEVVEAVLAGNVSYKELSAALYISVNTVKAHLKHIYQTTGVSSIAALSSLFHGYIPK